MIDVIIPVWAKNADFLPITKAAIDSISTHGARVLIVDNGSTVGKGALKEWSDVYIRNEINFGYAKAVNQGIRKSKGKLLAIGSNDIRVSPNWLRVAKEIFKDPMVGSVHYRMLYYDEEMVYGDKVYKTGKERFCTSPFFVIRRKALPKGLYDENYGLGGYEDWDFWHRVRHLNKWQTAYTTKACYQHFDSFTQNILDQKERAKEDIRRRDYFRGKFGKYPEEIWWDYYPGQMATDWRSEFLKL